MPSHLAAALTGSQPLPAKKPIRKQPKPTHQETRKGGRRCAGSDSECTEEATMAETVGSGETEWLQNLQRVTRLVKFANFRFKYSVDTYLVCLTILQGLRLPLPDSRLRLIAAAVLLVAAKVHEFRTPKFLDLLRWGEYEFRSVDLVNAEAELLTMLNFKVPVAFKATNMKAIEQEIERLEARIHAPFQ